MTARYSYSCQAPCWAWRSPGIMTTEVSSPLRKGPFWRVGSLVSSLPPQGTVPRNSSSQSWQHYREKFIKFLPRCSSAKRVNMSGSRLSNQAHVLGCMHIKMFILNKYSPPQTHIGSYFSHCHTPLQQNILPSKSFCCNMCTIPQCL